MGLFDLNIRFGFTGLWFLQKNISSLDRANESESRENWNRFYRIALGWPSLGQAIVVVLGVELDGRAKSGDLIFGASSQEQGIALHLKVVDPSVSSLLWEACAWVNSATW